MVVLLWIMASVQTNRKVIIGEIFVAPYLKDAVRNRPPLKEGDEEKAK
jgi:hypothetical protein